MDPRPLIAALDGRLVGSLPSAVTELVADSRRAVPGAIFVALRGERSDGHDFAAAAVERGASVVVAERELALPGAVAQVLVGDSRRAASILADRYHGRPSQSLVVAGVTGTNGKTTTTHLLAAALQAAGMPCAVVGTLGAHFRDTEIPLENTTPLALELHEVLARLREAGAKAIAMEVSSHALALERVDDIRFATGTLTNITRDHLDFHGDFPSYRAAKRRLFDLASQAIVNEDDPNGALFAIDLREKKRSTTTYAIDDTADVRARNVEIRSDGSSFEAGGVAVSVALPGRFNVYNALAALVTAQVLGAPVAEAARGIASVTRVPGRMERVTDDGVTAIVDYAHTPDALRNVLHAAREATRGRLVAVFGCGGDRDAGKRPQMGAIAREYADAVIVTNDNPRSEDPLAIAEAIVAGGGGEIVLDRREAIRRAVFAAAPGDTVVVAGKGHEPYQIVGSTTLPFDDLDEVRAAFALRREAARS